MKAYPPPVPADAPFTAIAVKIVASALKVFPQFNASIDLEAGDIITKQYVNVGIAVAPVIPGYNESDIPGLLERAKEAGATRAFMSMLHLDTDSIEQYFVEKMNERLSPTAAKKITNTIKRERGGTLRHNSYKDRGVGKTEQWELTRKLFEFHTKRLGYNVRDRETEVVPLPNRDVLPREHPIQPGLF